MGHIGFTPQYKKKFKPQGINKKEELKLIKESKAIEKAGAFSLVLECIAEKTAKKITNSINIPTIGIGAGPYCNGQIQVYHDLLGLYSEIIPKHAKRYADLSSDIKAKLKQYKSEVETKQFPSLNQSINKKSKNTIIG